MVLLVFFVVFDFVDDSVGINIYTRGFVVIVIIYIVVVIDDNNAVVVAAAVVVGGAVVKAYVEKWFQINFHQF